MEDFASAFNLEDEAPKELGDVVINAPAAASMAMGQILRMRRQLEEAEEIKKAEIARITDWYNAMAEKIARYIGPYEYGLKMYIKDRKAEDKKYVLRTPHGSAFIKSAQPKIDWGNDEVIVDSLKEMEKDDLVKVSETPNKEEIKKLFNVSGDKLVDGDGCILEGVTVSSGEETLQFRLTPVSNDKLEAAV